MSTGGEIGLNPKERRVYPLCDWATADVLAYCRGMRLPPAADLGKTSTSGVNPGDGPCMLAMRKHYPKDFERVVARFPNARAVAEAAAAEAAHLS